MVELAKIAAFDSGVWHKEFEGSGYILEKKHYSKVYVFIFTLGLEIITGHVLRIRSIEAKKSIVYSFINILN